MVITDGLNFSINQRLMYRYQQDVLTQILTSAAEGRTKLKVSKRGFTPDFIDRLSDEGVDAVQEDDDHIILIWNDIY